MSWVSWLVGWTAMSTGVWLSRWKVFARLADFFSKLACGGLESGG